MIYLTSDQMREVDRRAVEDYGIQIMQLMENAARDIAQLVREKIGNLENKNILGLSGKGNNGGDVLAALRQLQNQGAQGTAVLSGQREEINELSQSQFDILKQLNIDLIENEGDSAKLKKVFESTDLIIDGILGYSIKGDPRGLASKLIELTNQSGKPILAVDMPSGLNPDTGKPGQPTIKATWTLTLAMPKMGLKENKAKEYVGELYLADISIPPQVYNDMGLKVENVFRNHSLVKI